MGANCLISSKTKTFTAAAHQHRTPPCCTTTLRSHIHSLLLVLTTFFLTSLFHLSVISNCSKSSPPFLAPSNVIEGSSASQLHDSSQHVQIANRGWPRKRGYGGTYPPGSLKIYVYDEKEIDGLKELLHGRDGDIHPSACVKGQWGTQVKIHRLLLRSRFRTRKKEEANLFFVPAYAKCIFVMGGLNETEINETYIKVVSQMPYFTRSGGRDHMFVFPSGGGAHLFRSWATYINRSIFLTPEGDRTDKKTVTAFNTWKDIIIPGNVVEGMTNKIATLVQPLPLSKRKYLANYLGRAQGKIGRLKLIKLAKQYPNKLESPVLKFSGVDKLGTTNYFLQIGNNKLFPTLAQFQILPCSSWRVFLDASLL